MNKWIGHFMSHLRKFYFSEDLTFIYNDLQNELGIAASDVMVVYKGNDKDYFASDFEKCLSKFWEQSPCKHWTRIEIYVMDGVLWFAKRVVYGPHFCCVKFIKLSKKFDQKNNLVSESDCLYLNDAVVKHVTSFDMNFTSYSNKVLLEFQERFDSSVKDLRKLKFK